MGNAGKLDRKCTRTSSNADEQRVGHGSTHDRGVLSGATQCASSQSPLLLTCAKLATYGPGPAKSAKSFRSVAGGGQEARAAARGWHLDRLPDGEPPPHETQSKRWHRGRGPCSGHMGCSNSV